MQNASQLIMHMEIEQIPSRRRTPKRFSHFFALLTSERVNILTHEVKIGIPSVHNFTTFQRQEIILLVKKKKKKKRSVNLIFITLENVSAMFI